MRRPGLALVVLVVLASCTTISCTLAAQQPDQLYTASHEQLEVTKVLLTQQDAWNKGDLAAYVNFYKGAPDTVAVLATPIRGLQSIYNAYLVNFPNAGAMGTLDESEVNVRELGDNFALATGKYVLSRSKKAGGDAMGTFTDIFEKTPKGWRIIYSSTT
jgi:ketosteroid isomerase-like protein